jgi:transcriptional regulator with XRE-family HTH domain
MVNIEDFSKRLIIIMEHYEISAALLAEKIDVQRSNISHILSGRNKPSLDFVLKILKAFPEVQLYWLLNGVGTFPKKVENSVVESPPIAIEKVDTIINKVSDNPKKNSSDHEIDRIVIFFKDGTFKNYNP